MGKFQAGTMFILLVVYFVFFITIVNAVIEFDSETANIVNGTIIRDIDFVGINYVDECSSPRFIFTNDGEVEESRNVAHLSCQKSLFADSQDSCNEVQGCSWVPADSGSFWFIKWGSNVSYCNGTIDADNYSIDTFDPLLGPKQVDSHNNSNRLGGLTNTGNVCNHPNVIDNRTLCNIFSCTWGYDNAEISYSSPSSILGVVGDVFTFRYNFGFQNEILSLLFQFIFIVLPLILLIVSIYFMLPLVH